jgi:hypothetical protein
MREAKIHRFARTIIRFNLSGTSMIVLAAFVSGCSGSNSVDSRDSEQRAVYFCRETKRPVVAAVQPTPAINPATGRRTLVRALYCPQCKAWRAVPPDAAANGNPLASKCPKHRCPLTADGPLPAVE